MPAHEVDRGRADVEVGSLPGYHGRRQGVDAVLQQPVDQRALLLHDGLQVRELLLEALGLLGQLLLLGGGGGPLGLVVPGPARKKNRLDVVC